MISGLPLRKSWIVRTTSLTPGMISDTAPLGSPKRKLIEVHMSQGDSDELIRRKLAMIKSDLEQADQIEERKIIYECDENHPVGPNDIDGMEEMLGDDVLDTDWDIAVENSIREDYDGHKPHPDKPAGREKLKLGLAQSGNKIVQRKRDMIAEALNQAQQVTKNPRRKLR